MVENNFFRKKAIFYRKNKQKGHHPFVQAYKFAKNPLTFTRFRVKMCSNTQRGDSNERNRNYQRHYEEQHTEGYT